MKKTNAERQASYRARKRNARNATKAPIGGNPRDRREDYYDQDGNEYIFICEGNSEPLYAMVLAPVESSPVKEIVDGSCHTIHCISGDSESDRQKH